MSAKKSASVVHILSVLFLAVFPTLPAFAHTGEDAHSAPAIPEANIPMELVTGEVFRTIVENRVTNVTTSFVALRQDDGQRITLDGKTLDTLEDGARAEAIGRRIGSAFVVTDHRTVAPGKAQRKLQPAPDLQVEGALLLAHLDFLDSGRGEYVYTVRDDAGRTTRLNLASGSAVAPGMRVIARGTVAADGSSLDVSALTITAAPEPKAVTDGQPIGQAITNNVLVVLLKFTDSPASDPFTQAQVQDVMTNATTGVAHYYSEVSYGQQTLNITVTNWLVGRNPGTHAPMATPPGCNYDTMGTYGNTAATDAGFTGTYQNRFYVMPPNGACGFIGVSYIGGNTAWSNGVNDIKVYAHELGHNFGLYHAASLTCAGGASIGGACSSSEYGDPFDVMGNISSMHFNSTQKAKLGWIPTTSVKTQGTGFQQYTLDALENGSGSTYAIKIPIAANPNRTYWIEYRQPLGFDSGLPSSNANGAQIRVANPFETCTGCQFFLGLNFSDDTELLDMTATGSPGDFSDARLAVGSTFTDSTNGISVQVVSSSASQLVVNVTTPGGSMSPTTTSLVSSLNPATAGNSVTFTASVTGTGPTGTVRFTDGGNTIGACGTVALVGSGNTRTATCNTASLLAGTHSVVAAYAGDGSNTFSNSAPLSQVVNATSATTTSIASANNPSLVGANVSFTATVVGTAPTGSVSFSDSGTTVAGCSAAALGGSGNARTATCSTAALTAGTHSMVAAYAGDGSNVASSSSPLSQVVNATSATSTGIASATNPSLVGANVTFTASVVGSAPTGNVSFSDSGTTVAGCGAVALGGTGNTRIATCSTAALAAGSHSIVAAYAGDGSNTASSSLPLAQVVNTKPATTTSIASATNPSLVGVNVTFTASVVGNAPTGNVSFTDSGTTVAGCGAVALVGAGNTRTAVCATTALLAGTHSMVAAYAGDGANAASSSSPLAQVVNSRSATTATVASAINPSIVGTSLTFSASVSGNAPTGSVNFTDGGTTIAGCGSVALAGVGNTRTAVCITSTLSALTHVIVVSYAGDAGNLASSSAALSQVVNRLAATTGLTSSSNPSNAGINVSLTATVTGMAPTGVVAFNEGGIALAGCSAVALGGTGNSRTAACTIGTLSVGSHSIVAIYGGDGSNSASASSALLQNTRTASGGVNVALASAGSVASASSTTTAAGSFPVSSIIDSERAGVNWGNGGGWNDNTGDSYPDWVEIDFGSLRSIERVIVYTVQDNYGSPVEPYDSMTFSQYGITDFSVQGWNGSAWVTLSSVAGNNLVKRSIAITPYTTDRIRINVTGALAQYSRITEVEAYGGSATKAASTTVLASSLNPAPLGSSVTFTATVSGAAPAGSVAFTDGGVAIASCSAVTLVGAGNTGTAACATSALSAGAHSIVASYAGNTGNLASSSAPLSQVVNPAATTTTLSSSANPSIAGSTVIFSALVTGNAPTGTVNFTDGGAAIGSCGAVAVTGSGNTRTATCTTSAMAVGTHTVAAAYSGSSGNAASSSTPLSQVVNSAGSTVTLSSSANPSSAGKTIVLTVNVTGAAPTGTVSFADHLIAIAGCGAVAMTGVGNTRVAVCSTATLGAGIHTLIASYSGDGANAPSSSGPLTETVTGSRPIISVVSSRMVHGTAGTFDLSLSATASNPTTEPRLGPAHSVVFTFDKPITSATVAVTEGIAVAAAPSFSGNSVIVSLTGVANQQYVTVALSNVTSADLGTGGTETIRIGFLAGDVNQNRIVTLSDLAQLNAVLAQPVTPTNYLKDIGTRGTLTVADKAIVIANLAKALPAP